MSTEKKLTAMQELIELRNKSFDVIKFVKWFDENKNYILEKEKQQIIDSGKHGANFENSPFKNAEEYYEETYKKD